MSWQAIWQEMFFGTSHTTFMVRLAALIMAIVGLLWFLTSVVVLATNGLSALFRKPAGKIQRKEGL
jgi:hypothetical protein